MPAAEPSPSGQQGRICVVTADPAAPSYRYRIAPLLPLLVLMGLF